MVACGQIRFGLSSEAEQSGALGLTGLGRHLLYSEKNMSMALMIRDLESSIRLGT